MIFVNIDATVYLDRMIALQIFIWHHPCEFEI